MSDEPLPLYAVRDDYPLLFAKTAEYDFAERLGGCSDPLLAEIDAALREIWDARRNLPRSKAIEVAAQKVSGAFGNEMYFDPDWPQLEALDALETALAEA